MEQLSNMQGIPVWVESNEEPYEGRWHTVEHADLENPDRTLYTQEGVTYSEYGKYFTAYFYKESYIAKIDWLTSWLEKNVKKSLELINTASINIGDTEFLLVQNVVVKVL